RPRRTTRVRGPLLFRNSVQKPTLPGAGITHIGPAPGASERRRTTLSLANEFVFAPSYRYVISKLCDLLYLGIHFGNASFEKTLIALDNRLRARLDWRFRRLRD